MALISGRELFKINKSRNAIHNRVECSYTSFLDNTGKKYLQLDTYGSKNREFKGKISQSFQMDEETAIILINILRNEFKLKS